MAKYENYKSNLAVLKTAPEQDLGNEFVLSGIIDKFSMQFELAWKLLQKALQHEGRSDAVTGSPRGIIKAAYSTYDFIDEEAWLAMLDDRNAAEHVYDSQLAITLVDSVLKTYIPIFESLLEHLETLYDQEIMKSF